MAFNGKIILRAVVSENVSMLQVINIPSEVFSDGMIRENVVARATVAAQAFIEKAIANIEKANAQ